AVVVGDVVVERPDAVDGVFGPLEAAGLRGDELAAGDADGHGVDEGVAVTVAEAEAGSAWGAVLVIVDEEAPVEDLGGVGVCGEATAWSMRTSLVLLPSPASHQ